MTSWKSMDQTGHDQSIQDTLENLCFEDSSWGNDMCASFHSDESGLRLWIDYKDPADRECEGRRFTLHHMNGDMEFLTELLATESWDTMCERINQELRCLTK